MTTRRFAPRSFLSWTFALLLLALPACGDEDPAGPSNEARELGVVLNSLDLSLTLFDPETGAVESTVGLGPDGSPVGFSAREGRLAVPLGVVPGLAVVDASEGRLLRTVTLPQGSGATGSDFVDDTLVAVANSDLNSVSVVNVLRGSVGPTVTVGSFPQAVAVVGGRIYVANGELGPDFCAEGPGTVSVLDASTFGLVGTVELSGVNPSALAAGPDGRIWVLSSGQGFDCPPVEGSLSAVDPGSLEEVAHHAGFGDFPGSLRFGPDGRVYVTSFSYGVAIWDPQAASFDRAPDDALAPGGVPSSAGVGFDARERLYSLAPTCDQPAVAYRLAADFQVEEEVEVGTCPIHIAFFAVGD